MQRGHQRRRCRSGSRGSGVTNVAVTPGEDPTLVWIEISYVRMADRAAGQPRLPLLPEVAARMALIRPDPGRPHLRAAARGAGPRIPVYTPEWTDHNESDPGIALLELFAYLGESLLYRFNQIPDTTRIAFLRLLGVRPLPAQAARVLLAAGTERPAGVQVLKGAQASAGPVAFETDDEVYVWPVDVVAAGKDATGAGRRARLTDGAAGRPGPGRRPADRTRRAFYETRTVSADPLAARRGAGRRRATRSTGRCGSALLAQEPDRRRAAARAGSSSSASRSTRWSRPRSGCEPSDTDGARGAVRLRRTRRRPARRCSGGSGSGTDDRDGAAARSTSCGDTTTRADHHRRRAPSSCPRDPAAARRADDRPVTLHSPPPLDRPAGRGVLAWLQVTRPETQRHRRRHRHGALGRASTPCRRPRPQTAEPELLGSGTGEPASATRSTNRPVLPGTVELEVEETDGWEPWTEVDSFAGSQPTDRHYSVDLGGRARSASGGRAAGAADRRAIRVVDLPVRRRRGRATSRPRRSPRSSGRPGSTVLNPLPAGGGADAATLAEALDAIPDEVHRRDRAVTAEDFRRSPSRSPGCSARRDAAAAPPGHAAASRRPAWSAWSIFPDERPAQPGRAAARHRPAAPGGPLPRPAAAGHHRALRDPAGRTSGSRSSVGRRRSRTATRSTPSAGGSS